MENIKVNTTISFASCNAKFCVIAATFAIKNKSCNKSFYVIAAISAIKKF